MRAAPPKTRGCTVVRTTSAAFSRGGSAATGTAIAVDYGAVDLELSDEQRLIQDTVRAFVDERVLPVAVENDVNHRLDMSLIEGMAELGILGIVIPEEYGGAGLAFVSGGRSCEGIERGGAGLPAPVSVRGRGHSPFPLPL